MPGPLDHLIRHNVSPRRINSEIARSSNGPPFPFSRTAAYFFTTIQLSRIYCRHKSRPFIWSSEADKGDSSGAPILSVSSGANRRAQEYQLEIMLRAFSARHEITYLLLLQNSRNLLRSHRALLVRGNCRFSLLQAARDVLRHENASF